MQTDELTGVEHRTVDGIAGFFFRVAAGKQERGRECAGRVSQSRIDRERAIRKPAVETFVVDADLVVEIFQPADLRRLDVTPGMTGLWQITARRDPSFQRNMELDLEYIEKWNLWMDLRILYKTFSVVMQGSGM